MRHLKLIFSALAVLVSVVLCQQIVSNSIANQQNKNDLAELDHVKYGLLSIDEWKRQVTIILAEEINKLYLSRADKRVLRKHIKVLLNTLIDKVDKKIREENADTASGRLTQTFIDLFVDLDTIKKGIPEYADAVIKEMDKATTRRQVRTALKKQLEQYSSVTFDLRNTPKLGGILLRTNSADVETARLKLRGEIAHRQGVLEKEAAALVLLAVTVFSLAGFSKHGLPAIHYVTLVLILIGLLFTGVTTPAIDMEAKISQMSFMLLGHPVNFENQVLYFQSKSILDVFRILIAHPDMQMKLVAVLLITFSIIFPLLKIASTLGFYLDYRHARRNPLVRFFVLYSGKWSMADVMVVAIFMAYIGFDGIIATQLGLLNSVSEEMVLLTTNGTSLQPGYFLFLSYTLLALFLSELLTRKHHVEERRNPPVDPDPRMST